MKNKKTKKQINNFPAYSIATLLFLLMIFDHVSAQTNYYFSASRGDDSRTSTQAQYPGTPWKTITRLNSYKGFTGGDSILFKKNEVWSGTIIVPASGSIDKPIIISSYGKGAMPVINCLPIATNWSSPIFGVYSKAQNINALSIVFEDGIPLLPMATSPACTDGFWYGNGITFYYRPKSGQPQNHVVTTIRRWSDFTAGIDVSNRSYITIDGLQFYACGAGIKSYETIQGNSGIAIRNCTFKYCHTGIFLMPDIGNNTNARVENCFFFRNQCAVRMYTTEALGGKHSGHSHGKNIGCIIRNNEMSETGTVDGKLHWNYGSDNEGIGLQNFQDGIISDNYIHDGFQIGTTIFNLENAISSNNIITCNRVYNNGKPALVLQGRKGSGTYPYAFIRNIISNNIYANSGNSSSKCTLYLEQGKKANATNYIINNTIYGIYSKIFIANSNPAFFSIKNNIISGASNYRISIRGKMPTDLLIDYNQYYETTLNDKFYMDGGSQSISHIRSKYGFEKHGRYGDPLFINAPKHDFHLKPGSPCINAGIHVGNTEDKDGVSIPQGTAPDIGAYEFIFKRD